MSPRSVLLYSILTLVGTAPVAMSQREAAPQLAGPRVEFRVPNSRTVVQSVDRGGARVSRDAGATWRSLLDPQTVLQLRYARFDPLIDGEPAVPDVLRARADGRLFIVQFETQVLDEYKRDLARMGAERRHVLPDQAFVVRMDPEVAERVAALPYVRWVGAYHPAYRLEDALLAELVARGAAAIATREYNLMMVDDRRDRAALLARIDAVGGDARPDSGQGILQVARLTAAQLLQIAAEDTVLWIDRLGEPELDVLNARLQGGADYVETVAGIDGKGIVGMVQEGIYGDPNHGVPVHPEFAARPPYRTTPIAYPDPLATPGSGHGNSTAGIVFARGGLDPSVKGILPFAQPLYCDYGLTYGTNARKAVTQWGVSSHHQVIETSSWGYPRTLSYDARSAEMDDIVFDLDMVTTQSQSNDDSQMSRPQAWAKNIIAVGGFDHRNTATPADDLAGNASYGPSADLRQKPDFAAYTDYNVDTTGGAPTGYTARFNGTSAAAPIVNGFAGIVVQMFAEGHFGHPAAATWADLYLHRPHFTTVKSLLAASAYRYDPNQLGTPDLTRARQGWGFPDVAKLFDQRERMLVSDEEFALRDGRARDWFVFVPTGTPELRVSMNYADPEANPAVQITRQNSVDLRVDAPDGSVYWGNHGMTALSSAIPTNYSVPGGVANDRDTTENVFVLRPAAGVYRVRVHAAAVRVDAHVETGVDDVDFGLVIDGVGGGRNRESIVLDLASPAAGVFDVALTNVPASGWVEGFTLLSASTALIPGNGDLFGLEFDGLANACFVQPTGSVFHFVSGQPGFPGQPHSFPAVVAQFVAGMTFDGVAVLFDANADVVAVSNVDRVTVR